MGLRGVWKMELLRALYRWAGLKSDGGLGSGFVPKGSEIGCAKFEVCCGGVARGGACWQVRDA